MTGPKVTMQRRAPGDAMHHCACTTEVAGSIVLTAHVTALHSPNFDPDNRTEPLPAVTSDID